MPTRDGNSVADVIETVREEKSSFPVLRLLCLANESGIAIDSQACSQVAEAFGRDANEVEEIQTFVSQFLGADGVLMACRGLSCHTNGAAHLSQAVVSNLCGDVTVEEVHCLSNCHQGPSLSSKGRVYSGSSDTVHVEERIWREGPVKRG